MAARAIAGDAGVIEAGGAREAYVAAMARNAIGCRRDVIGALRYRCNAEKALPIMASGATRDDPAVIHAGVGPEGHSASMAGLAGRNRGWNMIGGPAGGHGAIVAGRT